MNTNDIKIGSIDDPAECAAIRARIEAGERNLAWLAEHWAEFLPQARGRFLAVAAQEGHIADSPTEAWAWAKAAHPEDAGALVQYVRPETGPRIYAYCGKMALGLDPHRELPGPQNRPLPLVDFGVQAIRELF